MPGLLNPDPPRRTLLGGVRTEALRMPDGRVVRRSVAAESPYEAAARSLFDPNWPFTGGAPKVAEPQRPRSRDFDVKGQVQDKIPYLDPLRPARPVKVPLPGNVDWDWVYEREKVADDAPPNVPPDKEGNSGVTVAHGLDLGRNNERDLQRRGVPMDLIERFRPYLLRKGENARQYLAANPLDLSQEEQEQIDGNMFNEEYKRLVDSYNKAAAPKVRRFQDLPEEAQTAIMDVAHNYELNLPVRTPTFWKQITEGRWADAEAELRNFHDDTSGRRKLEADKLHGAIKGGWLPKAETDLTR